MPGRLVSTPLGNMMAYDGGTQDTDSWLRDVLGEKLYGWLMRSGQGLAEGYGAQLSPKPSVADIMDTLIQNRFGSQRERVNSALLPGIISAIEYRITLGEDPRDILAQAKSDPASLYTNLTSLAAETAKSFTPPSTQTGQDTSGLKPLGGSLFQTPDGSIVDLSTGISWNEKTGLSRLAPQAPVRTAAEEAASWAAAGANQAQAEATRAGIRRQEEIDAAVRSGRLYDTPSPGIFLTPTGQIFNQRELDLAAERNNISRDDLKEKVRSNLASEAGRAEERAILKAYNDSQVRLKEQELTQTGEYQRGQLEQGLQRLAIDRYTAEEAARARAQQNALEKEKYIADVLRNPSDFVARSFASSGATPPQPVQTQADRINAINTAYAANPTTVAIPTAATTGTNLTAAPRLAYGSNGLSHYAQGSRLPGFVNDRLAVVGDPQRDGRPNPEVIYNPTGAPISVTPMRNFGMGTLATYANGTGNMVIPGTGGGGSGSAAMITRLAPHYADGTDGSAGGNDGSAGGSLQVVNGQPMFVSNTGQSYTTSGGQFRLQSTGTPNYISTPTSQINPSFIPAGGQPNVKGIRPQDVTAGLMIGRPYDYVDDEGGYGYFDKNYKAVVSSLINSAAPRLGVTGGTVPSTTPAAPITKPTVTPEPTRTQEEIIAAANRNMSPRMSALFQNKLPTKLTLAEGSTSNPFEPSGITPYRLAFSAFTPQMLQQLTDDEKLALNSYLAAAYNISLPEVMNAMTQLYTVPAAMKGGRLSGARA